MKVKYISGFYSNLIPGFEKVHCGELVKKTGYYMLVKRLDRSGMKPGSKPGIVYDTVRKGISVSQTAGPREFKESIKNSRKLNF